MAVEWLDAFELGTTAAIIERYTSGSITALSSADGRTNQYIRFGGPSNTLKKTLPAGASKILGFAMKQDGLNVNSIVLRIMEGATTHLYLQIIAGTHRIAVYNGDGTLLATTSVTQTWTAGFWIYLEFQFTIDDAAGAFVLRANEVEWLNETGLDTQNGGTGVCNAVQLSNTTNNASVRFDDLYVANLDAPMPLGDFYGNLKIEHRAPSGAGSNADFTPSAGANYGCVDENPQNGDTDYVYSPTADDVDTYAVQDMVAVAGSIRAVQVTAVARKDDALERSLAIVVRSDGADYDGDTQALGTSYVPYFQCYDEDPATAAAWEFAGVNAMEIGAKVIA
jgi:hypothetical protein